MKSQTLTFLSALCICTATAYTAHAWSPAVEEITCTSDEDCGSDAYCALVATAICELDEDTGDCLPPDESELSGFCAPLEEPQVDRCTSDEDCGPGTYCEVVEVGATCDFDCPPEEECELQCDDPELTEGICVEYDILHDTDCFEDPDCLPGFHCEYPSDTIANEDDQIPPGYCVEDYDVVHPTEPGCIRDSDCAPDEFCSPDGYCDYNWVIPSPGDESCFADEDCGAGGVCVDSGLQCRDGEDCMIPAFDEPGHCEYDIEPIDPSECVVAVYGVCVAYAGDDAELSCDASSGAPTWLAFLALLGLVRRRKDRR